MSNELKPCPFCGGEAVKEFDSDWGLVVRCLECPAIMTESPYLGILEPVEAWNTRAERTCNLADCPPYRLDGTDCPASICSNCGYFTPDDSSFCMNCGAKVIRNAD